MCVLICEGEREGERRERERKEGVRFRLSDQLVTKSNAAKRMASLTSMVLQLCDVCVCERECVCVRACARSKRERKETACVCVREREKEKRQRVCV